MDNVQSGFPARSDGRAANEATWVRGSVHL